MAHFDTSFTTPGLNVKDFLHSKADSRKNLNEMLRTSKAICYQVIGVQPETPLAWSANGQRFAFMSGNKSIYICAKVDPPPDAEGRTSHIVVEKIMPGNTEMVRFLLFSPTDNNLLVSGGYDGIMVWDVAEGVCVQKINHLNHPDAHESDVLCGCWVYGGSTLVTGSKDCYLKVWDASEGWKCMETITGHKAPILSIVFDPLSGKMVSAGRDSSIKIWNTETLSPNFRQRRKEDSGLICTMEASMDGHRGDITTLTFTGDGAHLFSGARDNTIRVWDMKTAREIRCITAHMGDVRRIALINDDQYMFTCSVDATMKLWKLLRFGPAPLEMLSNEQSIEVGKKALDEILKGTADISLDLAMTERDELLVTVQAHEEDVMAMEINPVFPLLATSSSYNNVRIWDIRDVTKPQLVQEFVGHSGPVTSMTLINNDEHLITASADYNINMYDVSTMQREAIFPLEGSVLAHVVTPDEKYLFAGGTDYSITCFCIDSASPHVFKAVAKLEGHSGRLCAVAIDPEGRLMASGAHDFNICLWKLENSYPGDQERYHPLARVQAHEGHVMDLSFSQNIPGVGVLLASCGNDHSVKVWRVSPSSITEYWSSHDAHSSVVSAIAWGRGPSENFLFSGSWDKSIKVWNAVPSSRKADSITPVDILQRHDGRITKLAVTPDGKMLASASSDCVAMLWSTEKPFDLLCAYVGLSSDGALVSLATGHGLLVTGFDDGMVKVWPMYGLPEYEHLFNEPSSMGKMAQLLRHKSIHMNVGPLPVGRGKRKSNFSPALLEAKRTEHRARGELTDTDREHKEEQKTMELV